MKQPRSTEARLFAQQVARDVRRRDRVSAPALYPGSKTCNEACTRLFIHFGQLKREPPGKRARLLKRTVDRLNTVPVNDRNFALSAAVGRRIGAVFLVLFTEDDHPMDIEPPPGQKRERGIVATRHDYVVSKRGSAGRFAQIGSYVAPHALERLYDRWPAVQPPTLEDGIRFLRRCHKAAQEAEVRELIGTGICFPFLHEDDEPVYGEGRMWLTDNPEYKQVCHWFDCRTVLTHDMLAPDQLAQASAMLQVFHSDDPDLAIPTTEPRDNYISRLLDAADEPPTYITRLQKRSA